jgi:hypothetical protein
MKQRASSNDLADSALFNTEKSTGKKGEVKGKVPLHVTHENGKAFVFEKQQGGAALTEPRADITEMVQADMAFATLSI